jgi:hypothetical protein
MNGRESKWQMRFDVCVVRSNNSRFLHLVLTSHEDSSNLGRVPALVATPDQ